MLREFVKLMVLVILVAAIGAFFLGYRWASPRDGAVESSRPVPATGTMAEERSKAREVGAEIGETVAAGAHTARRLMTNAELTAKIKSKMALDDTIRASAIDVDTSDGTVTLTGGVGSPAQRQRALQLARETDGVTSVVDRLVVREQSVPNP